MKKVIVMMLMVLVVCIGTTSVSARGLQTPEAPPIVIDPLFGIPKLPVETDALYDPLHHKIATTVLTIIGLIGTVIAIRLSIKEKSLLPLAVSLSPLILMYAEVFFDVMGLVYYPRSETDIAYTILGRQMPWWLMAGWYGYGGGALFTYYFLSKSNMTVKVIWLLYVADVISGGVFEEILVRMGGLYVYYGNQPLKLTGGVPWWWEPVNGGGLFLAASLAVRYREAMKGWKALGMFPIMNAAMCGFYGFVCLPAWVVVNEVFSWGLTQATGILVVISGFAAIAFIINIVLGLNPFNMKMRLSESSVVKL